MEESHVPESSIDARECKIMDVSPGEHIGNACKQAVELANTGFTVCFEFNGTKVVARPGDTAEQLKERWAHDQEAAAKAYRESSEYKERIKRQAEELRQKMAAHMTESAQTETEMREAEVPCPLTIEQLSEYVLSLINRSHDYGTCVYAMSMAAAAAFNYVSSQLGVSGFQASCADLDTLRRIRRIKGPFVILKGEDALFPQCELHDKLSEALAKWQPWLKEEAKKKIAEAHEHVSPNVLRHWQRLANMPQEPQK